MKRLRPSLVRRLTIAFAVGAAATLTIVLLALQPLMQSSEETLAPDVAISIIKRDLIDDRGRLALQHKPELLELQRRSPGLWFIVQRGRQEIEWGAVPDEVRQILRTTAAPLLTSANLNLRHSGVEGIVSIERDDTSLGDLLVSAGGVRASAVTFGMWLRTLRRERLFIIPLAGSLLTFIGGLIAIPIVLRSLRPTARAAAELDGTDLQRRLPERRVVKELLPIVRAFNAALDRLSEAFERRRRFIADVAHELRTPLAVLNMHVEELPASAKKPDLQRTVYRLGQMVGQMLDAERLTLAGRKREPVDLVALARDAIANVAPLAISNGYAMAFNPERENVTVDGDAHAIATAISNLLGNAIAHGGGSGTIEVRVSQHGTVDVCDEGPGVPVEARERIFEPFHRERWDKDGCGLGLHLVREIMRAHGGSARVVSSGPGAAFRLEFPHAL